MDWTDVIGLLGFVLSVVVFILTRWERRKNLVIDLECLYGENFNDKGADDDETMLVIRVINSGGRAIVIDKKSIKVIGPKKAVGIYDCDWIGLSGIPHPLNPGESFEVGLWLNSFEYFQGYEEFSRDRIAISAELSDIENKSYQSKAKYELFLEVGDIHKVS